MCVCIASLKKAKSDAKKEHQIYIYIYIFFFFLLRTLCHITQHNILSTVSAEYPSFSTPS